MRTLHRLKQPANFTCCGCPFLSKLLPLGFQNLAGFRNLAALLNLAGFIDLGGLRPPRLAFSKRFSYYHYGFCTPGLNPRMKYYVSCRFQKEFCPPGLDFLACKTWQLF